MSQVTFVISDLGRGGAQRVLTNVVSVWSRSGVEVCVITLDRGDRDFFKLGPSIRRIAVGRMGVSHNPISAVWSNLKRVVSLRKAIRSAGSPVVVGFVGSTNILVILASLGLKKRVVISERNDPQRQSIGKVWDILRWALYRLADGVTANSHGAIESLSAYVPRDRLAYLPNVLVIPPDDESVRFSRPTVLAVGRLHRQKGFDALLDSFALLAPQAPDWQLVIVGDGPERDALCKQARRLDIADRVIWQGPVENPFPFYRAADIFALPSRYEGTPNALLEAMACGLPVVVSDASPGPLEWVEPDICGQVVPTEDAEALAEALLTLIRNPALRKRFGQAARERALECDPGKALPVWEQVIGLHPTAEFP